MAIDTRNKRASALSVAGPWLVQLPLADGTIEALDRTQGTWTYSGIAIGAPAGAGKSGTHVTQLGEHGYSKRPRASVARDPNAGREACVYLSLICTRAVTKSCDIDGSVSVYESDIDPIFTYQSLICTRALTKSSAIDGSVTTISTGIGC